MEKMEENDVKTSGETDISGEKKRRFKKIVFIAALLSAETAMLFLFKPLNSIQSIPLKMTAACAFYVLQIAFVFIICRIEKRRVADLGFYRRKLHIQILIGLGIAVVLSFLIGALPILIGGSGASLIGEKRTSALSVIFAVATDIIFIGLLEELIYRGYIQKRINELTKYKFVGVLIAAALFGLSHIINGAWIQVGFAFLIGGLFGFCREYLKNCSLLSVVLAHGVYDALLVVIGLILL
jgi:membrane protease YdiL (CAAX protease family)